MASCALRSFSSRTWISLSFSCKVQLNCWTCCFRAVICSCCCAACAAAAASAAHSDRRASRLPCPFACCRREVRSAMVWSFFFASFFSLSMSLFSFDSTSLMRCASFIRSSFSTRILASEVEFIWSLCRLFTCSRLRCSSRSLSASKASSSAMRSSGETTTARFTSVSGIEGTMIGVTASEATSPPAVSATPPRAEPCVCVLRVVWSRTSGASGTCSCGVGDFEMVGCGVEGCWLGVPGACTGVEGSRRCGGGCNFPGRGFSVAGGVGARWSRSRSRSPDDFSMFLNMLPGESDRGAGDIGAGDFTSFSRDGGRSRSSWANPGKSDGESFPGREADFSDDCRDRCPPPLGVPVRREP
eukprot:Sspe_Gene.70371::Locus_41549_Transcript_1_1_Confidence_1.000_Length_1413::g.70371::m.70371